MIKHYKTLLTALMLLIASSSVFAQHSAIDIAALQNIIANNFTTGTELNWGTESNPDLWDGVTWDASSPQRVIDLQLGNTGSNNGTGKVTDLSGAIDLTALTMLEVIGLQQNTGITSVNCSGLTNLTEFRMGKAGAVSINLSNCTSLDVVKSKQNPNLTTVNVSGCAVLDRLGLRENPVLNSINMTGCAAIAKMSLSEGNFPGALNLSAFTTLEKLQLEDNALTALNVTGLTQLTQLDAGGNLLTDVVGLTPATQTILTNLSLSSNRIPFSRAAQIKGEFTFANMNNNPNVQGATIAAGGTADYSSLASVTVNGSPVTTNFELFDDLGNSISTNTTGLFTIATSGGYYITLTNSGYSRNTNPIIVGTGVTADPSFSNADYLILMGFKTNNFTTSDFNWGGVSNLDLMTGVTWDGGTPRRVTRLELSKADKNQGSAGPTIDLNGTMNFTGLTMLDELYLVGQTGVTNINISGLADLSNLFISRSGITALNASSLTGLSNLYASGDIITSIDVSNSAIIGTLAARKTSSLASLNNTSSTISTLDLEETGLTTLDVSGDAIGTISIEGSDVTSLNASNCTSLTTVIARRSALETLNLSGSAVLTQIRSGNCNLTSLDVTGATALNQIRVGNSNLRNVTGASALTSLNTFRARENKMLLSVAAPFFNIASVGNKNFLNQHPYSDTIVDLNDNVDYSNQASITINGTPVTSTFNLYDIANTLISTNSTGIFTMSTVGDFYVEMSNSGVTVRTENIEVIDVATQPVISASLDNSDFGTTSVGTSVIRTLTITNTGGATLTVSNIILPSGFTLTGSVTTIAAAASATLTVTFTPSTAMTYNGNILIVSDAAAGSGQVSVTGIGSPVSGVYTKSEAFLSFYPNPTSDKMLVQQTNTNVSMLYIYSMDGILVQEVDLGQSSIVDVQGLAKGVYVVKSEDGKITERFVKL